MLPLDDGWSPIVKVFVRAVEASLAWRRMGGPVSDQGGPLVEWPDVEAHGIGIQLAHSWVPGCFNGEAIDINDLWDIAAFIGAPPESWETLRAQINASPPDETTLKKVRAYARARLHPAYPESLATFTSWCLKECEVEESYEVHRVLRALWMELVCGRPQ